MGTEWLVNTNVLCCCSGYVYPTKMERSTWVLNSRLTLPSFAAVVGK